MPIGSVALVVALLVQDTSAYPLIPEPRELVPLAAQSLRHGVSIEVASRDDSMAVRELDAELRDRHIAIGGGAVRVQLLRSGSAAGGAALAQLGVRFDTAMRDEGYVLATAPGRVRIIGATAAGVLYGVETLKQLIDGTRLRGARIRDWPALRYRGIHDDLSRGPLPTLEFQKQQIRTFAAYKLNVYSPYYEHTLAYRDHPLIAPPPSDGAMTRDEVRSLVAYAAAYHVTVIPEQEAFGHLHHLLLNELYAPLGETPHGDVLAPDQPGSLRLVADMYREIDSLFPGPFVHLGADETFELGRGQTADRVRREGVGAVYIDFLTRLSQALRGGGKRLLFWGDIATRSPTLIALLPKDLMPVVWRYDAAPSFDAAILPFRNAGLDTWVAPGVSNWSRVYPDYAVALPNIQRLVRDGQRLGAVGVLNTTWDDDGEALFNQTWYGVLFGAAASWQAGESSIERFQQRYGRAFYDDTSGAIDAAERKLMAAHALLAQAGLRDANDEAFWSDPWSAKGQQMAAQVRPVAHDLRMLAESALVLTRIARRAPVRHPDALAALELGARRADFIGMKSQLADEIVQLSGRARAAAGDTVFMALGDAATRIADLREGYALIRDEFDRAWRRENRPYWLSNVLLRYDAAAQLWNARAERLDQARDQWRRTGQAPAPDAVGIPASVTGLP